MGVSSSIAHPFRGIPDPNACGTVDKAIAQAIRTMSPGVAPSHACPQVRLLSLGSCEHSEVYHFLGACKHLQPLSTALRTTLDYRQVYFGSHLESYVVRCVPLLQRYAFSRAPQLYNSHAPWVARQIAGLRVQVVEGLRVGAEVGGYCRTPMWLSECQMRAEGEGPDGGQPPCLRRALGTDAAWTLYVDATKADRCARGL